MTSSKYRLKVIQRIVLVFSLTCVGLVASGNASHARSYLNASGFGVYTHGLYEINNGLAFTLYVNNESAAGNVATCSIKTAWYLGLAKIGEKTTSFSQVWIPKGVEFKVLDIGIPQALSSYSVKVEEASCTTSPEPYMLTPDKSLAFIPSDQSQLEFQVFSDGTQTGWLDGFRIINRSQYPIYTNFDFSISPTSGGAVAGKSDQINCRPGRGDGTYDANKFHRESVGGRQYVVIYPAGTQDTQSPNLELTVCFLNRSYKEIYSSTTLTSTPLLTFALMPAPAPAAQPVPSILTFPAKKKYSTKALASQLGVVIVSPKAKVSFKVSGPSKKICTKSGTKLRTLKAGNCVVTFTVQEPKPKKGKKPKATKTTTTFAVQ